MIIARICLPKGQRLFHGSVEVLGSPAEDDYRMGGWFPVDSFNFGFQEAKKDDKAKGTPAPTPKGGKPAPKPGTTQPSGGGQGGAGGEAEAFSSMNIEKEVDRATPHLMVLAMEEKSKKAGADRNEQKNLRELHADIHVLSSVSFKDSTERHIFPSMMVHLEGVRVTSWSIKGSGDARPSESVALQYDRAAMQYTLTLDGKVFQPSKAEGWNQTTNERWPTGGDGNPPFFDKYLPKQG